MFGHNFFLMIPAGALLLTLAAVGLENANTQETDCTQLEAQLQQAESVYKEARHKQEDAFKVWDKYYKALHSDTYAGTEEPLADTAEKCESEEPRGNYCSGAMEDYETLTASEQQAKQKLDAAKAEASQAEANLSELKAKAEANACDAGQ